MGDTWKCLQCGKRIDKKYNKCDCGYMRYGKNNEYAPNMSLLKKCRKAKKRERADFQTKKYWHLAYIPKMKDIK